MGRLQQFFLRLATSMPVYWIFTLTIGYLWITLFHYLDSMDIRSLVITPKLLKLISEIDELKGVWSVMHSLTPDRLQSLRKVATIESIGSSTRIEGSKLTDEQIGTLLDGFVI